MALAAYLQELVAAADDAGFPAMLEEAQGAWLTARDATCELVYREIFPGTFASVQRLECQAAETARRVDRLRAIFAPPDDELPQ
jgi:uncharacterized protein YecT (DUF1311 family)